MVPAAVRPEMADDEVGAGEGHRRGLVGGERVRAWSAGPLGGGERDHFDLEGVGDAGVLEAGAEGPVDQADRRESSARRRSPAACTLLEEASMRRNGSVPQTPASTGVILTTGRTSGGLSITIGLASP